MKPILIAGIGRCGTSYLYLQMLKNYENKVLYEPLNLFVLKAIKSYLKLKDLSILKYPHSYFEISDYKNIIKPYIENFTIEELEKMYMKHPLMHQNYNFSLFYDKDKLESYILMFKSFHIKEVGLNLYINEDFIKNNWMVFYIIRYPIDNFISYLKLKAKRKSFKLSFVLGKLKIIKNFLKSIGIHPDAYLFYEIEETYRKQLQFVIPGFANNPIEKWLAFYIYVNYNAIKSIPKDHLIVYEKPKTYKRLPFELKDPLRIKIYPKARENLAYEFEKIAKKLGLEEEYNYLLRFFD